MINKIFHNTVSALCYSVVRMTAGHSVEVTPAIQNKVSRLVVSQYEQMPSPLRPPFFVLTIVFALLPIVTSLSVFHRLCSVRREKIIRRWKSSRVSFARDFIRFFESLCVLFLYDFWFEKSLDKRANGASRACLLGTNDG